MNNYDRIAEKIQKFSNYLTKGIVGLLRFINYLQAKKAMLKQRRVKRISSRVKKTSRPVSIILYILFSLVGALFSAFSSCVFHHLRTTEGIEAYYTDNSLSLARDILHAQVPLFYILIPILALVYFFLRHFGMFRGLSCRLTAAPLAFNMIVSLSMEHSQMTKIFLPNDAWIGSFLLNTFVFLGFNTMLSAGIGSVFYFADKKKYQPVIEVNRTKNKLKILLKQD